MCRAGIFPAAGVMAALAGMAALGGCADGAGTGAGKDREAHIATLTRIEEAARKKRAADAPEYLGIQTRLLDGDLVNFLVEMRGAQGRSDVIAYAECAAAQYALIRGYGFARHVRTNVSEDSGLWRADAVYTISPALPRGLSTIDAEVTVSSCAENGIPTV